MASNEELEKAIIGDYIPLEMIQVSEKDYKQRLQEGSVDDEIKFSYGWHLVKSRYKDDIRKGIKIMGELCQDGTDQRDYHYFMAIGYYKLEDYQDAEHCINRVLNMEPNNSQAKELKNLIANKIRQDTLITAGLVGGAALVGAAAIGTLAIVGGAVVAGLSRR